MTDIIDMHPEWKDDTDQRALVEKLHQLLSEHRDLDDVINQMTGGNAFDQLQLQRLKKRKLNLKDDIARIKARIVPDIIA